MASTRLRLPTSGTFGWATGEVNSARCSLPTRPDKLPALNGSRALSEEILDLVNEHDEVIGQLSRAEVYRRRLANFRVVNTFA